MNVTVWGLHGSTGCVIFSQPSYNLAPHCMFPSYPRSCLQGANAPWTSGPIFHRLLQCLSLEFPQSPRTGSQWANGALAWSDPNPGQRRRMLHMTNKLSLDTSGGEDYTATNGDGLTIRTCDNVRTSRRRDFHPIPVASGCLKNRACKQHHSTQ